MISDALKEIMNQVEVLSPDEQLHLLAWLADITGRDEQSSYRRAWREIQGQARHPLLGEDAQTWVSRNRQAPITPGVAELAHKIEKARLEAGVTTEELMEGLRDQRQRYYQEKYGELGATE
jgi:hypothetical protein